MFWHLPQIFEFSDGHERILAVVLEQHGEPPEQYPSWDDEYE